MDRVEEEKGSRLVVVVVMVERRCDCGGRPKRVAARVVFGRDERDGMKVMGVLYLCVYDRSTRTNL